MAQPLLPQGLAQPNQSPAPQAQDNSAQPPSPVQVSLPGMSITPTSAERMPAGNTVDFNSLLTPDAESPPQAAIAPGTLPGVLDRSVDQQAPGGARSLSDVWARFKSSFGQTPKEQAEILNSQYGKGTAKLIGDKVMWRRPGEKKYTNFDADVSKAQGIFETLADIADFGGDAAQYAPATAMAALPGGIFARTALGGVGGAAGSLTRSYVANQLGAQNQDETLGRAGLDAMLEAVMGGAPAALSAGLDAYRNSPGPQDVRKVATQRIRMAADDFARQYQVVPGARYDAEALGGQTKNAIQMKQDTLNAAMEMANQKLIATNPDKRYPANDLEGALKKFIDEYAGRGTSYDRNGNAVFTAPRPEVKGEVKAGPVDAFGLPRGQNLLESLVNEYNEIRLFNKSGGLDAKQWADKTRKFQKLAEYDKRFSEGDSAPFFAQVEHAARADRAKAFAGVDPSVAESFKQYSDKYEPLKQFNQLLATADQQNRLSTLAEGIFANNSPQRVRDFVSLFKNVPATDGAPGMLTDRLKGLYVQNLVDGAVEKNGLFNGFKMREALKDSTAKAVLSDTEINQLKSIATRATRVKTSDLLEQRDWITNFIMKIPFINKFLPSTQVQMLQSMMDNSPALLHLLDEDALASIRKLPLSQQENYFQVAKKLEQKLARVPTPDTRSALEKTLGNSIFPIAGVPAQKSIKQQLGAGE